MSFSEWRLTKARRSRHTRTCRNRYQRNFRRPEEFSTDLHRFSMGARGPGPGAWGCFVIDGPRPIKSRRQPKCCRGSGQNRHRVGIIWREQADRCRTGIASLTYLNEITHSSKLGRDPISHARKTLGQDFAKRRKRFCRKERQIDPAKRAAPADEEVLPGLGPGLDSKKNGLN